MTYSVHDLVRVDAGSIWYLIDSAPKDRPFLAWYESEFGPKFGTMQWEPEVDKKTLKPTNNGRFQSMTTGTQTKCATHWMDPEAPRVWGDVPETKEKE